MSCSVPSCSPIVRTNSGLSIITRPSIEKRVIIIACFSLLVCGTAFKATTNTVASTGPPLSRGARARVMVEERPKNSSRKSSAKGESSHECIEGDNEYHRVCIFKDIYMFNGTLFYVVPEADLADFELPEISLRYMLVHNFIPGGDWLSNRTMRPVTHAGLEALAAGAPRSTMPQVAFWSTWVTTNYYHVFAEFMPTLHATLCKYLGKCTYDSQDSLQLIDLLPVPSLLEWPAWFHEALACFTTAPHLHIRSPKVAGRLVHIGSALMGVGSSCRARHLCGARVQMRSTTPRASIEVDQMRLWRERLGACLGFDTQARAPLSPPQVLLVDRPRLQARHMVNADQLTTAAQKAFSGLANVSMQYMEGLTLRQQASLWSRVSVAAYVHGAALSNWVFMPQNSVVVQIVPRPRPDHVHDVMFTEHMELDLYGVTGWTCLNLINPKQANMQLQMWKVARDPVWRRLSKRQQAAVLKHGDCSVVPPKHQTFSCERGWFNQAANLVVQPRLLNAALATALKQVHTKSGEQIPEGLHAWQHSQLSGEERAALQACVVRRRPGHKARAAEE